MTLRRLIPLALAAYAAWRRISPEQKRQLKHKVGSMARSVTTRRRPPTLDPHGSA